MNTYLVIMVTILVVTQVIRIVQNGISLYRQEQAVKKDIGWLKDNYVTKEDFLRQREMIARLLLELRKKQRLTSYDDIVELLNEKPWYEGRED